MATPTRAPLVVLAGVEKTYHSGRVAFRALRGIDLEIEEGEMVAIAGPSGSGKTTIVNLIAGIDRPSAGTVMVNGTRLDLAGQEDLAIWRRANIGMVFQFFQLMPTLSALDNAMLPMELARQGSRRTREKQARTLLSAVALSDRASRLPVELSGGEQQRVALPGPWRAGRGSSSATSRQGTSTARLPGRCSGSWRTSTRPGRP